MTILPRYLKLSQITLGLVAFFFILYIGRDILVPLTFSLILSILLNPVVNFFTRIKINKIVAIVLALTLLILIVAGIMIFLGSQVSMFTDAWPQLKQKFNSSLNDALTWVSETFNIGKSKVNKWVTQQKAESLNSAGGMIGDTLSAVGGVLALTLLIPVYIFLFLFYKPLLLEFIARLFPDNKHKVVASVLAESKSMIQNYLVGLLIEMAIVASMNSLALFLIGIEYALLLGVIGAILNLIPYIGGIIAISLPMIMAMITDNPNNAIFVFFAYLLIQFIDNNFLVPKIVASKVKVNALISIVVVLIGGALWGVAGMFLSIPLIAIAKVIFDRIDELEPFGFLIGDTMPDIGKAIFEFPSIQPKRKKKKVEVAKA